MSTRRSCSGATLLLGALATGGCRAAEPEAISADIGVSEGPTPGEPSFRLPLCDEAPVPLPAPPGAAQSAGCVVNYTQTTTDDATLAQLGTDTVARRYLVYAPEDLPDAPAPVVFVFPGYGANAEAAAFWYTQMRFEALADRDGFIVVYGNGLPFLPEGESGDGLMEKGGYLQGCLLPHAGEGIDVQYVREILDQLDTALTIDRTRVYATGLSAGGGLGLALALEAPDLVAAVAPVAGLPFQPDGIWRFHCNPHADVGAVSIAMLGATADPFIAYEPGPSLMYPTASYPGMPQTRDAWLAVMGISAAPEVEVFPDHVPDDSYAPHSGMTSSYVQVSRYPTGTLGSELWYYEAVGAGHWWPNPTQMYVSLWPLFGKTNQDIDFADQAWAFFQRHATDR